METIQLRAIKAEFRMVELEDMIRENGCDEHQIDLLRDYARRIHSGLILNGGVVERDAKHSRSLEDMKPT